MLERPLDAGEAGSGEFKADTLPLTSIAELRSRASKLADEVNFDN